MKWLLGLFLTVLIGIGIAIGLPFEDKRTICWDWPITNTDGTPLTDLAGAKFYYSKTPGAYLDIDSKDIGMATPNGSGSACYTEPTLEGTWNVVLTAYNTAKVESQFSMVKVMKFAKVPRTMTNVR